MVTAIGRRLAGVGELAAALVRNPGMARDLPRWVRQAGDRKDPLSSRRPWWNYRAVQYVDRRLQPGHRVFEYGGGASTLWLVDRGCQVRTVEHDRAWYEALTAQVKGAARVDFLSAEDDYAAYVDSVLGEDDGSLDLVIVDGRQRVRCGLAAMTKVKTGGMLLLDDAERPRYEPLHTALASWPAAHLRGLKAGDWAPRQTSVWTRPDA